MIDYFSEYKKALKAKYEIVKEGKNSDYLLQPTVAKLRNLCMDIYGDGNRGEDDKNVFKDFFGFEYDVAKKNQVVNLTDKFRAVRTFLLNESDITESNNAAANMLAVLLDFEPRPQRKFRKQFDGNTAQEMAPETVPPVTAPNPPVVVVIDKTTISADKTANEKPAIVNTSFILKMIALAAFLVSGFYAVEYYLSTDGQCMQWQRDHYQQVDCQNVSGFKTPVMALREKELDFRQIYPKKADPFMKNGEPIVWYSKSDGKVDFFNQDGKHPLTEKDLGPATFHIMNKYGK